MLVRTTDRAGRGHVRVGQQGVFDQGRVDVVAAADDEVLDPAGQLHESVGVQPGQVTGVQPAVTELPRPSRTYAFSARPTT
jgi:hypothetical protein